MKCKKCDKEMSEHICKYFTLYKCENDRHKQVILWDEVFRK